MMLLRVPVACYLCEAIPGVNIVLQYDFTKADSRE